MFLSEIFYINDIVAHNDMGSLLNAEKAKSPTSRSVFYSIQFHSARSLNLRDIKSDKKGPRIK